MFFITLAGAVDAAPINRWYFLEAATGNIPNAPDVSRWTFWNVCARTGSRTDCSGDANYLSVHPAFPFNPPGKMNFNTEVNVPKQFIKTDFYYLMTRFMFAFNLIALFFGVCALFTGVLALCTRLGAYLSGLLTMIAAFFQAINCSLMT
jgi:SUR7/PalI family